MTEAEFKQSRDKDAFIAENYMKMSNVEIGRHLGISEKSIRQRALRLGIPPKGTMINKQDQMNVSTDTFQQTLMQNNFNQQWKYGWLKTDNVSVFVTNPESMIDVEGKKEEFLNAIKKLSPKVPKLKYPKITDKHLLIVDPADVHLGKLATDEKTGDVYNVKIAIERVLKGIDSLLEKTKSFPIEKIVLVIGNDILHTDTPRGTTTAGTNQDTDGMWFSNYQKAFKLYVDVVEKLQTLAPVHIVHCPSNHDWTSGYFLAHAVEAYFTKNPNITFDTTIKHRKAFLYGKNLIGFTHGDGAKEDTLPQLMAQEFRKEWGVTERGYWYCHHRHHYNVTKYRDGKDYIGVTIEYLRAVSANDRWHSDAGYVSPQSIYAFIHDHHGQVAKITHNFAL